MGEGTRARKWGCQKIAKDTKTTRKDNRGYPKNWCDFELQKNEDIRDDKEQNTTKTAQAFAEGPQHWWLTFAEELIESLVDKTPAKKRPRWQKLDIQRTVSSLIGLLTRWAHPSGSARNNASPNAPDEFVTLCRNGLVSIVVPCGPKGLFLKDAWQGSDRSKSRVGIGVGWGRSDFGIASGAVHFGGEEARANKTKC